MINFICCFGDKHRDVPICFIGQYFFLSERLFLTLSAGVKQIWQNLPQKSFQKNFG